jgi:hypothetical protein
MFFLVKTLISALIIATVSTVSKRYPGFGGLIASLPLISILGAIWLWWERPEAALMSDHLESTFWFVLPSLPMFLLIPAMLRRGAPFWPSLAAGCLVTIALYGVMLWLGPKAGLKL